MNLPPPPISAPWLEERTLRITAPWQRWLQSLWQRVGGALALTPQELEALADALQVAGTATDAAVLVLTGAQASTAADVGALQSAQVSTDAAVSTLGTTVTALDADVTALDAEVTALDAEVTALATPAVLSVADGVAAPGLTAGRAVLYVDTADGALKVVFASGTVKTLTTDP